MSERLSPDHLPHEEPLRLGRESIAFIGPEGSGKSTAADRLSRAIKKPYISTGQIFREKANDTEAAYHAECQAMLDEQRYLEPKIVIDILTERLSQPDTQEGFVLDGGFRTLEETKTFPHILEKADRVMPITIFHLQISRETSEQRLKKRQRADDTPQGIYNRLSSFYKDLDQRLEVIEQQPNWHLIPIDASGPLTATDTQVLHALRKR